MAATAGKPRLSRSSSRIHSTAENVGAALSEVAGAGRVVVEADFGEEGEQYEVEFFPNPPCVAPCEDDGELPVQGAMRGHAPQSYFKSHATWKADDPEIAAARQKAKEFVDEWRRKTGQKQGDLPHGLTRRATTMGNLRTASDIAICEAFINISPHKIGIRVGISTEEGGKTGEVIESGQCVVIDKVVEEDSVRYLRLADGRGWLFDSDGHNDLMAKLEDVEVGETWYRVCSPTLVDIRRAPVYDAEARTGRLLCPREMAVVDIRARVRGITFVHLGDGRGWIFTAKPNADAKAKRRAANAVLEECDAEVTLGDKELDRFGWLPPTNEVVEVGLWTYVVGLEPLLAVGAKLNGTYIEPGDVVKVDKRAFVDGTTTAEGGSGRRWLHLHDGRGWVPETDAQGRDAVTLKPQSMLHYPSHFKGVKNIERPSAEWMVGVV